MGECPLIHGILPTNGYTVTMKWSPEAGSGERGVFDAHNKANRILGGVTTTST